MLSHPVPAEAHPTSPQPGSTCFVDPHKGGPVLLTPPKGGHHSHLTMIQLLSYLKLCSFSPVSLHVPVYTYAQHFFSPGTQDSLNQSLTTSHIYKCLHHFPIGVKWHCEVPPWLFCPILDTMQHLNPSISHIRIITLKMASLPTCEAPRR